MTIEVRLFATLRKGRFKKDMMSLDLATPEKILDMLAIDREDVAILLINGRDGSYDQDLVDGDVVSIFPPVGGG
jgi:sulfur carrier protein